MNLPPRWTSLCVTAGLAMAATLTAPGVAAAAASASEPVPASHHTGLLDSTWNSDRSLGSLYTVTRSAGVQDVWADKDASGRKITGKGIGVALIDSGVTPVTGLDNGRVVNGPDLSFESQDPSTRYVDTFGHGTHMAGIIAGRDPGLKDGDLAQPGHFVGVAPGSTLVNMKVATRDGAVDVSQVIAAIDWAVQHKDDPGLNIRVINLAYGTDSTQSYLIDPLAYAVENAWQHGIVVVVAAGNDGNTSDTLTDPAIDPFVLAVGAADHQGTYSRSDDTVATFSSRGSASRSPDLVAPGRSIESLRDPGSYVDVNNPSAVVSDQYGPRLFRGSGTSQAAAFTSGTVALLLQQRPNLTPDQVKALLKGTADRIPGTDTRLQGAGLLDVDDAVDAKTPGMAAATQVFPQADGTGSLEAARGTSHVAEPETGIELTGEQDIFGQPWDGRSWALAAWQGRSWAGGSWTGSPWPGSDWAGRSWASVQWTGRSWAGRSWAEFDWSGRSWAGRSWAGRSWAGRAWASTDVTLISTDITG